MTQVEPLVPAPSEPARRGRFPYGRALVDAGLLGLAGLCVATLFAGQAWLPDMLSFFRPHVFYLSLAVLAGALAARRRGRILLAAALAVFCAAPLLVPDLPAAAEAPAGSPSVRIMSANLLRENTQADLFKATVTDIAPDVLVVQEENHFWRDAIDSLRQFPHRASFAGVDVASRFPMEVHDVGRDMASLVASLGGGTARRAAVDPGPAGRPFVIYAIHAPTPRTLRGWQERSLYLAEVARLVREEPEGTPVIVAGDWNTPVWSPVLSRFLEDSGTATAEDIPWPPATRIFDLLGLGLPYWLGTPIDRVVVSKEIAVEGFHLGSAFGSDHLPVYADVVVGQGSE